MRVVLDSNIFIGDLLRGSPKFKMLEASLRNADHELFVPGVVFDEVMNHFRQRLLNLVKSETEAVSEYRRLARKYERRSLNEAKAMRDANDYHASLRDWLNETSSTILEYPEVSSEEIAVRAIARKKPFAKSGRGYQDTIIWLSIVRMLRGRGPRIALVTNDKKDFAGTDGNLHSELASEWRASFKSPEPLLFNSLDDFVEAQVRPKLEIVGEGSIISQIDANYLWGHSVEGSLNAILNKRPAYLSRAMLPWPTDGLDVEMDAIVELKSIKGTDLRKLNADELVARLVLNGDADLTVTMDAEDYEWFESSGWPYMDILEQNDEYVVGSVIITARIELDVTIDAAKKAIKAVQVRSVSPDSDEPSPGNPARIRLGGGKPGTRIIIEERL